MTDQRKPTPDVVRILSVAPNPRGGTRVQLRNHDGRRLNLIIAPGADLQVALTRMIDRQTRRGKET